LYSIDNSAYYVDFPAGRLACVSSLSSTISFTLVAALMTTYGFVVAQQILCLSTSSSASGISPTPRETSTVIRILNAEVPLLRDLDSFEIVSTSLHLDCLAGMCCLRFSISSTNGQSNFIQAADTYILHVVVDSVSATRIFPDTTLDRPYSRRLAPWCFDDEGTFGTIYNKIFFSCGITRYPGDDFRPFDATNRTLQFGLQIDFGRYITNFTDEQGTTFAIVVPDGMRSGLDCAGTTYGTSSKCSPVPTECLQGGRCCDSAKSDTLLQLHSESHRKEPLLGTLVNSRGGSGSMTGVV
jgi:hypothetical protein